MIALPFDATRLKVGRGTGPVVDDEVDSVVEDEVSTDVASVGREVVSEVVASGAAVDVSVVGLSDSADEAQPTIRNARFHSSTSNSPKLRGLHWLAAAESSPRRPMATMEKKPDRIALLEQEKMGRRHREVGEVERNGTEGALLIKGRSTKRGNPKHFAQIN